MALIKWTDKLSVGVREMDRQHQIIIGLINDLHDAMLNRQGQSVLARVLDESIDYAVHHFSTEERLMQAHGLYGDHLRHVFQHKKYVDYVRLLQAELAAEAADRNLNVTTLGFLSDWWNNHILKSDMKLGKFLNSKGIF
jgi:hemerythrin